MSCNSLSALPLVGALALFLTGAASPSFCLPPAPQCPDVHEKSPTQAGRCGDPTPPGPTAGPKCEASQPPLQPEPEQPKTYTMTIVNGTCATRVTFIWRDGDWQRCDGCGDHDVYSRDCPRSAWQRRGTYNSPRCTEEAACSLRTRGNPASVRRHCP
jgi:hypothetical protein